MSGPTSAEDVIELSRRFTKQSRGTALSLLSVTLIYAFLLPMSLWINGVATSIGVLIPVTVIAGTYMFLALFAALGWPVQCSTIGITLIVLLLTLQWWIDPANFRVGWHIKTPVVLALIAGFFQAIHAHRTCQQIQNYR